ncbi:MAG: porin family protein [Candidatus Palauibacterales bacterium]|nr:porin family protein [Candidatus Palauibacterales bacterium]MDP2530578.1 porin family protein [Candidatus Palauibacterales bacterium]MDP2583623.1 porin family protein [Candidatus Palauibacterales bacterium]
MKRLATGILSVVLTLALSAAGRPAHAQGLALGVEGGVNFARVHVNPDLTGSDISNRTGVRIAGVLRYDFAGPFGLQTGVAWSQKGAKVADTSGSGLVEKVKLDYFQVPLFLTLTIPTGPSPVHPRLFAGPQVGIQSRCNISATDGTTTVSAACDSPDLGEGGLMTKKTTFGLAFGGGLDFDTGGPVAITVDGRYELGLTDINDSGVSTDPSIKNRSFSISGGLLVKVP